MKSRLKASRHKTRLRGSSLPGRRPRRRTLWPLGLQARIHSPARLPIYDEPARQRRRETKPPDADVE